MKRKIRVFVIVYSVLILLGSPASAKWFYKTFEVVEVTEKVFIIENKDGDRVEIEKSRRPYLEKGDKVRYDKYRNRLGKTLDKEEQE